MQLSPRPKSYMIPDYSLTGDLLSFLTCNLQYRYQNKGTLPPAMPIQQWFGEFIHGVMEEAFLQWEIKDTSFPWDWKEYIRPIEEMIDLRLRSQGLYPPLDHFCPYMENHKTNKYENIETANCEDSNHPHKMLASSRVECAINVWGPDLFPLIDSAEVLIKGNRPMPNYNNESRSNSYGINGVIDVISSLKIDKNKDNNILKYLNKNDKFLEIIENSNSKEYEIIIDYKGMKRPAINSKTWKYHQWQILTYSWLRSKQNESKTVVGGIIFYLNELVPWAEDLVSIKHDINNNITDVKIGKDDEYQLMNWDETSDTHVHLSEDFKKNRSIRVIPIEDSSISESLNEFDKVVEEIESSIIKEINGVSIKNAWPGEADKRTCDACDFKSFCKKDNLEDMKIP